MDTYYLTEIKFTEKKPHIKNQKVLSVFVLFFKLICLLS